MIGAGYGAIRRGEPVNRHLVLRGGRGVRAGDDVRPDASRTVASHARAPAFAQDIRLGEE